MHDSTNYLTRIYYQFYKSMPENKWKEKTSSLILWGQNYSNIKTKDIRKEKKKTRDQYPS
jgi:hypothetical protein